MWSILGTFTVFFTIPMIVASTRNEFKPSKEQLARTAKIERLSDALERVQNALQEAGDEDDNANGHGSETFSYDQ